MATAKILGLRCPVLPHVIMGMRVGWTRGRGEVVKRGRMGMGLGSDNLVGGGLVGLVGGGGSGEGVGFLVCWGAVRRVAKRLRNEEMGWANREKHMGNWAEAQGKVMVAGEVEWD
ncbi:unnamed protein product [Linum trigynum]|uniref:Uncharacterized protein n=1 Tax=Linum trigynum TaxID=586398 RepID=A0AAV2FQV7_9ROSI